MYGTNMHYFGHLINQNKFNSTLLKPEMFEIQNNYIVRKFSNKYSLNCQFNFSSLNYLKDWIERYVHKDYFKFLKNKSEVLEVKTCFNLCKSK